MMKTILKTTLAAGLVIGLAGCASDAAMQSQADQALNKAEAAQSTADAAQQKADAAQQTANEALQAANKAQATAEANSKRMERMFQASQRK